MTIDSSLASSPWSGSGSRVTIGTMKRQTTVALVLLLLMPVVLRLGGYVFSAINPESAAGHPNYVQNYHRLDLIRHMSFWGSMVVVCVLWLVVCFLVIRSKKRSGWWLLLAALGPFGFAALTMLSDRAPGQPDRYECFVRGMNRFVSFGYQAFVFVIIWLLASELMEFKRYLTIQYESARTGISVAQIMDIRDASGGMWAFSEGNEVIYFVILLYLIWPVVFNLLARVASPKAR